MLRLLHTSDWHLGHTLHGRDRRLEHEAFLRWLLDTLERVEADALLVAGDIFETANPPASAIHTLNAFLAEARRRMPELDIVLIAGNHDSALRLDAMAPMMAFARVHAVGGVPEDRGEMVFPLHDRSGAVAAWLAAVPFLRVADLPHARAARGGDVDSDDEQASWRRDPLIHGVERVYAEVLEAAQARAEPDHALIASGHLYMRGTALSELSERKILGGNQHAIPRAIFGDAWAYVGLGHLHLAQAVEQSEQVRYSGSPIPLSLSESDYEHQVLLAHFEGAELQLCQSLEVPRTVQMLRVPKDGPRPLDDVLFELRTLALDPTLDKAQWPWLEVRVSLDEPVPDLRVQVDRALRNREVRLLKIAVTQAGEGGSLADFPERRTLERIDPQQVFADCYERLYDDEPGAELLGAFHELREAVERGDASEAVLPPMVEEPAELEEGETP
ncbi:nuclease SbcCD, D subunit [Plesiocystis pacifica SIR-1]|uniref:Nuclease SbcCD subunit D n=1 Tax=Plesiocystis pacifica SIR-1 TaxID=391625 RepID=A6G5S9_9BACT|nr:exonuclease SbcCD subunit D C-terminal domain-containing protein [Plesiocystis pacifica]EDM78703.1 nuclease SbcCD, D subunit [Plesiocystis pacifica SIR-1]